jgi:four helix bundle protein
MAGADELRRRAKRFAIRTLKFVKTLPHDPATLAVARQLARSAPSVSANYHSAGRSRSRAEFRARLAVVADEADESAGWFEMLKESGSAAGTELDWLVNESRELRAIFVQAVKTARLNQQRSQEEGGS